MAYVAKKDFRAYKYGEFKKGQEVPYKKAWVEAGLIEERSTKPEPKKELEKKPEPKKKKATK